MACEDGSAIVGSSNDSTSYRIHAATVESCGGNPMEIVRLTLEDVMVHGLL